jgi:hypothetical protein
VGPDDVEVREYPAQPPVLVDDRKVAQAVAEHDPGRVVQGGVGGGGDRPGTDDARERVGTLGGVAEELLRADEADQLARLVRHGKPVVPALREALDRLADMGGPLDVLDLEHHVVPDADRHHARGGCWSRRNAMRKWRTIRCRSSVCCMLWDGTTSATSDELLQLPASDPGEPDRREVHLPGDADRLDHVRGVAASRDRDHDVAGDGEAPQLLGKDARVVRVVRPRHHAGYVVIQGDAAEPLGQGTGREGWAGPLGDVDDEMGGGRGAPAVPQEEDRAVLLAGPEEDRDDPAERLEEVGGFQRGTGLGHVGPEVRFERRNLGHRPTKSIRDPSGVIRTASRCIGERAAAISSLAVGGMQDRQKKSPAARAGDLSAPYAPAAHGAGVLRRRSPRS